MVLMMHAGLTTERSSLCEAGVCTSELSDYRKNRVRMYLYAPRSHGVVFYDPFIKLRSACTGRPQMKPNPFLYRPSAS